MADNVTLGSSVLLPTPKVIACNGFHYAPLNLNPLAGSGGNHDKMPLYENREGSDDPSHFLLPSLHGRNPGNLGHPACLDVLDVPDNYCEMKRKKTHS